MIIKKRVKQKYIFHIFPKEKFTDEYVNFINKNFHKKEHIFWLYGNEYNTKCDSEDNVIVSHNKCTDWLLCLKLLYKSQGIILHFFSYRKLLELLFIQPWLLSKLNIVFWGSDLYSYRKKKITIKQKMHEGIRKLIIKNSKYITTLVPGDYDLAKKWYKVKGIKLSGNYINISAQNNLNSIKEKKKWIKSEKSTINIQIGNNAQKTNRHLEAIDLISRFKDYNIKVYVPLSYCGDKEYISKVITHGKNILGNKFVPLLEFMSIENYNDYLSTIDVAIFNNDRQQGMGNINSLVYLGSKVFLKSDTSMWQYFVKENSYCLGKIEDINKMNFQDFITIKQEDLEKNALKVSELSNENKSVDKWTTIFKTMGCYQNKKRGSNGRTK